MFTASFLIYYHIDKGVDLNTFNWLIIVFLISTLIFDYPCGIVADYIGKHKSIYLSCIFWALFPLLLLSAPNFYGVLPGYICYSLGVSLYGGAHQAILSSLSNESNFSSKEAFQTLGKYNSFALFLFSSLGFLLYWQTKSYIYALLFQYFIFLIALIIYQTISYPISRKKHSLSLLALFKKIKATSLSINHFLDHIYLYIPLYFIATVFMVPIFWFVSFSIDQVEPKKQEFHNNELY